MRVLFSPFIIQIERSLVLMSRLNPLGDCIACSCLLPHQLALVQKPRSGHVCPADPLSADGPHRPTAPCPVLRDCNKTGGQVACTDMNMVIALRDVDTEGLR